MVLTVGLFLVSLVELILALQTRLPSDTLGIVALVGWALIFVATGDALLKAARTRIDDARK